MNRPVPQRSIKERREATVEALCMHFAADNLELQEFEGRLDAVHRATTPEQLAALLADLPAAGAGTQAAAQSGAVRTEMDRPGGAVAGRGGRQNTMLAFMGGVERRGHWTPARRNLVIAVMGGAELDFREVELPAGETEVNLVCIMGGAEIIVPPGLAVESSGIAIMGGFGHAAAPRRPHADAPLLKLTGFCFMGGVDIQVREPGESARDARRREKAQRRLRRGGSGSGSGEGA